MTSPWLIEVAAESNWRSPSSISLLDSIPFYGVAGLLMFGPLAFGAVEPWSIWIVQAGAGLFFALWAVRQVAVGELEIVGNPLFLPMSFFGALILLQLLTGRTAYRAQTFSTALLYCAYGVIGFLMVQRLRKTSQLQVLAWLFSGYGFAIALFALVQGISSNDKLYWLRTPQFGGWLYGPYVNHNHYAGLMEMLTPIPLVISCAGGVRLRHRGLAAIAAAVMASTIFLSGSRGGMVAFATESLVLTVFLVKRKNWNAAFALGSCLAFTLGLLVWLGGGELPQRIASFHSTAQAEVSGGTRLTIDRDALRMLRQRPLLGWGLGVFPEVYPQFRSFPSNLPVDQAHNDYLQVLVETGTLGFATVVAFLLILFYSAFKKLSGRHGAGTAITLASVTGISGILVHSFVDFNLQIPANAALFYTLCMVAAMEQRLGHAHRPHFQRHHRSEKLLDNPAVAATASTG